MFNWLRNRKRHIFYFRDGRRRRAADPIEVSIALKSHPKYTPDDLLDAIDGDEEAIEKVASACCDAFHVEPLSFDGKRGLTVTERVELVAAFNSWMLLVKKNIKSSATKPSSTAATSSESSEPTTSDTAPSGGHSPGPSSERQTSPA